MNSAGRPASCLTINAVKYYADYVHKTKVTMHLEHKPGEALQVDWAGQTVGIVNTDTGELIPAYLFVSVLPYSGYAYVETFLDEKQEAWITAHVHAYQFYGGMTRILTPDHLKTGVIRNIKEETVINKTYRETAEYYGTAIITTRPRTPKDKAFVEGSVGGGLELDHSGDPQPAVFLAFRAERGGFGKAVCVQP